MSQNIYQLMDALDYGDAVSNHVVNLYENLKDMGYNTKIFSKYVHDSLKHLFNVYSNLKVNKDDIVLFHFSGKTVLFDFIKKLNCKKVLVYHNITPPEYFKEIPNFYELCSEGINQLKKITNYFDYFIADSEYNKLDLIKIGVKNVSVLPIFIDFQKMKEQKLNNEILVKYKDRKIFLFVGRVAPNKKYEDIIKIFDYYYTYINQKSNLILVGNYEHYMEYYQKLNYLISNLKSKNNITFTGKVNDIDLATYYSLADIFLCMSEHEGFCVPLLESMSFDIPTVAYDAGAISTTMGDAGVLIKEKDHTKIAELINIILIDNRIRNSIIEKQREWVKNFQKDEMRKKIKNILSCL